MNFDINQQQQNRTADIKKIKNQTSGIKKKNKFTRLVLSNLNLGPSFTVMDFIQNKKQNYFLGSTFYLREKCSVFSPNTGKYGPEKNPYSDAFHAVFIQFLVNKDYFEDGLWKVSPNIQLENNTCFSLYETLLYATPG